MPTTVQKSQEFEVPKQQSYFVTVKVPVMAEVPEECDK